MMVLCIIPMTMKEGPAVSRSFCYEASCRDTFMSELCSAFSGPRLLMSVPSLACLSPFLRTRNYLSEFAYAFLNHEALGSKPKLNTINFAHVLRSGRF